MTAFTLPLYLGTVCDSLGVTPKSLLAANAATTLGTIGGNAYLSQFVGYDPAGSGETPTYVTTAVSLAVQAYNPAGPAILTRALHPQNNTIFIDAGVMYRTAENDSIALYIADTGSSDRSRFFRATWIPYSSGGANQIIGGSPFGAFNVTYPEAISLLTATPTSLNVEWVRTS